MVTSVQVGDFDGDGVLDVLVLGGHGCQTARLHWCAFLGDTVTCGG